MVITSVCSKPIILELLNCYRYTHAPKLYRGNRTVSIDTLISCGSSNALNRGCMKELLHQIQFVSQWLTVALITYSTEANCSSESVACEWDNTLFLSVNILHKIVGLSKKCSLPGERWNHTKSWGAIGYSYIYNTRLCQFHTQSQVRAYYTLHLWHRISCRSTPCSMCAILFLALNRRVEPDSERCHYPF